MKLCTLIFLWLTTPLPSPSPQPLALEQTCVWLTIYCTRCFLTIRCCQIPHTRPLNQPSDGSVLLTVVLFCLTAHKSFHSLWAFLRMGNSRNRKWKGHGCATIRWLPQRTKRPHMETEIKFFMQNTFEKCRSGLMDYENHLIWTIGLSWARRRALGGWLSEKFAQTSVSCPRGCGSAAGLGPPQVVFFFVCFFCERYLLADEKNYRNAEVEERERENKGRRKRMRGDEGRTADILIMWAGCSA